MAVLGGFSGLFGQFPGQGHHFGVYGRQLSLDGVLAGDRQGLLDRQVDESALKRIGDQVGDALRVDEQQSVTRTKAPGMTQIE